MGRKTNIPPLDGITIVVRALPLGTGRTVFRALDVAIESLDGKKNKLNKYWLAHLDRMIDVRRILLRQKIIYR